MTATGSISARPQALAEAERVLAMKGVFTIGIDRRFADELAAGVLAEHGGDPLALADVLILVPTRRSVRALREAFLRASDGKPTLLPRWRRWAISTTASGTWLPGDGSALALPPAIEPAEREALLAQLVAAFKDDQGHPIAQSAAQALQARARARPACSTSWPSRACRSTGSKAWSRATSPATGSAR